MATYHAFTRSRHEGEVTDEEAIEVLLDEYVIEPTVAVEDGELAVYGYCGFNVWAQNEEREGADYQDDLTIEFLRRLAPYIEGELVIKTVGHEKLRYVDGQMWRVKDGEVYHATLEDNEAKVPADVQPAPEDLPEGENQ